MTALIFAASIFSITFGAWFLNRIGLTRICPICAGVFSTWVWILAGIYAGILKSDDWQTLATMAMGGSVVGFAYFMDKRLPAGRSPALWKALFIPTGFLGVYGFLTDSWLLTSGTAIGMFLLLAYFTSRIAGNDSVNREKNMMPASEVQKRRDGIKKSLDDCC